MKKKDRSDGGNKKKNKKNQQQQKKKNEEQVVLQVVERKDVVVDDDDHNDDDDQKDVVMKKEDVVVVEKEDVVEVENDNDEEEEDKKNNKVIAKEEDDDGEEEGDDEEEAPSSNEETKKTTIKTTKTTTTKTSREDNDNDNDDTRTKPEEEEEAKTTEQKTTATTFESLQLNEALMDACKRMNWLLPTLIQEQVIPEAMNGRDMIGLAETGSGKTGAFLLPILHQVLHDLPPSSTQSAQRTVMLLLTPTCKLAFQIQTVLQGLGTGIGLLSICIVGGIDRTSQAIQLAKCPHAIIATPGRLVDHLKDTKGFHLRYIRFLVLDEADQMLSLDFKEELHQILDNLPKNNQLTQQQQQQGTSSTQQ